MPSEWSKYLFDSIFHELIKLKKFISGWDCVTDYKVGHIYFMTKIPLLVAAAQSILSTPVPARPIIFKLVAALMTSAVTLVAERTIRLHISENNKMKNEILFIVIFLKTIKCTMKYCSSSYFWMTSTMRKWFVYFYQSDQNKKIKPLYNKQTKHRGLLFFSIVLWLKCIIFFSIWKIIHCLFDEFYFICMLKQRTDKRNHHIMDR